MELHFKYYVGNNVFYQSETLLYVLHEMIIDLQSNCYTNKQKLNIEIIGCGKRHPMILDSFNFSENKLISTTNNITYDITKENDLVSLRFNYENISSEKIREYVMNTLINTQRHVAPVNNEINDCPDNIKTNISVKQISLDEKVLNTLEDASKIYSSVDKERKIENILFKDELDKKDEAKFWNLRKKFNELHDTKLLTDTSYESSGSSPRNSSSSSGLSKSSEPDNSSTQNQDSETKMLVEKVKKLKKMKHKIDLSVKKIKEQNQEDDVNCSKLACAIRDEEIATKKEEEKIQQEFNIFKSERTYTYPKIFRGFFTDKKNGNWNDLPPMFIAKFAIFLYLEGKNLDGKQVRENVLDSADGFRLYKLLREYLEKLTGDENSDNEFELPGDENDKKLVENFISNLPPIRLLTERNIMEMLNDPNDRLFNEDMEECDVSDDDKNETYNEKI